MPAFNVQKSIHINAPLEEVYALVRDFQSWPKWSPWLIIEPACRVSFAEDGKSYSWDGEIIGSGEMAVTKEDANKSIDYDLRFLKPWKSQADVRFLFAEKDGGSEVTWIMNSSLPWFMFWMKTMMIGLIGMDYERGLKMLKDLLEKGSVPSKLDFPGICSFPGRHYIGIKNTCSIDGLEESMGPDYEKLQAWIRESGVEPSSSPFSIYHTWNFKDRTTEYTVAFPFDENTPFTPAGFVTGDLPACDVYPVVHTGPYHHLGNAWSAGIMHGRAKLFRQSKAIKPFEVYDTDPETTPGETTITTIHFPVK